MSFFMIKGGAMQGIEKAAFIFFLFLFPGSFFYHAAVGLNYISPFFKGYISIVGLAGASLLVVLKVLGFLRGGTIEKNHIWFFIFIALFFLVSCYNFSIGVYAESARINILLAVNLLACYLIFSSMDSLDNSFKYVVVMAAASMSAFIFFFSKNGVFDVSSLSPNAPLVANYQTFALAYLPVMVVAIAKATNKHWRYALFLVAVYCLYFNGARSEFLAMLIFFAVFEVSVSSRRVIEVLRVTIFTMAAIASILIVIPQGVENRTSRLVNLSEDNSSNIRDNIFQEGVEKISRSPLLGDYGNYERGLYIHNVFSAWQDLGFFGFLYFCLMIAFPLFFFSRDSLIKRNTSKETALCLGMLVATSILLIYAKYFAYPLVAITLGMISRIKRNS
ncbi:O-antigen ligase family protein [Pseudomonas anguilliseptica]|uniref:O-antigen ligase family protein n=1 Tax=Pseudomonas anguilliseptica TaxID=53406 RepID=UPI0022AE6B28|nr:O-antigen ligase family protein [Pseudomonas anguilliseptica]MCZ4323452.1 O-antigen ligase family protein [Pseudomonas anguilliseptica]